MSGIDTVRSAFDTAIIEINSLNQDLAAERRSIKLSASPANRTAEQKARLEVIIENRKKLSEAKEDLASETFTAFENANDLEGLLNEINASIDDVEDTLEHLRTMADYAVKAAKVADGLATAATKLAGYLA